MSSGQPHTGLCRVDDRLVRRLVDGQFPRWAGLPVERHPSGGTVNAMYRLGEDMVVRLPLVEGGVADVATEREWLPRLSPLLPVAVPEVLGEGVPADGYPWPWSVHRWLPGEVPEAGALTDPVALAEDLGAFVAAMRGVTLPGAPQAYRGGPLTTLDAPTRAALDELRGLPEEGVDCDTLTAVWQDALRAPAWQGPPRWLHADLMPGNLLVGGGRLSAVIDFGCMGVGDPACDLFPAWNLLPSGAREVFREALGVDDATWRRGRGRALSQALIALPYYRGTNPAMAGNARHVIRAVLGERSGRDPHALDPAPRPLLHGRHGGPEETARPGPHA
ncbi:aminoglycoside phosphotransferase family protein [Streptomyces violaceorubidus]|uniref:aminoglycoside phosphotransferase family protein n=1 Tax=Streptomyces violaceorubidus TaxID=284042 RepID=UPI000997202F|nr:aminoglycoside phosphotransferase family protein [Streptomyces violaceorubidus]